MSFLKASTYHPPQWASSLQPQPSSRLSLAQLPTPIHPWNAPGVPEGVELWVKRDDRTGVAVSGNKIRKLEFLLAEAVQGGYDCVMTCGGIQSNHCRSTAAAARLLGLDSYLLLRTNEPEATKELVGNLLVDHMVNATIIPVSYEQYTRRATLMQELAQELQEQGRRPLVIPEGGSNALGTWGYLEAIRELQEQCAEVGWQPTDMVFACGSGGTAAGLALGSALAQAPWKVHAINVCDDAAYFHNIANSIFQDLQAPCTSEEVLSIIDGYKGLGYAKSRPEELHLLRDVAHTTGIVLDPVYTGKGFYGLSQELQNNSSVFQGNRILFIHTGGLFGLYDKASQLLPLLPAQPLFTWAEGR